MKILFVSPEVSPLVRTGGLGDVVGSLPLALREIGLDVRILCPLHKECKDIPRILFPKPISFRLGKKKYTFFVSSTKLEKSEVPVYFIGNDVLFNRSGIYSDEKGDFPDNALRAFALSKAAVELEKSIGWEAEIFHAHDWMAASTCAFINAIKGTYKRKVGSVLTIHNLEHQGTFSYQDFLDSHLPTKYWGMEGFEHNGALNLLKGGIQHATKLTTVSPTYAQEIKTVEFGQGLEKSLLYRAGDLVGILNGIDKSSWDPSRDSALAGKIQIAAADEGKDVCKSTLQKEFSLSQEPKVALFGVVSRLYNQKGLDLLLKIIPSLLQNSKSQFVILGSGDSHQERAFSEFAQRNPTRIATSIGFDDELARRIFAGSDFFLMPSRFEPCGLAQQYAMRYGSIPIGRETGGLADTIVSHPSGQDLSNGFLFKDATPQGLNEVIHKALSLFEKQLEFFEIRKNAMQRRFSWVTAAEKYAKTYTWALGK
ncbi:MAG: glycogen synthase GlgA [Puniceicoccaceae bacterium]|nr:glycogen synthase GlgA [Puniceicoccaceae bacterium]